MKNIGIIGGGIIGLCSAYYLSKSGHKVTIIDQGDLKDGCSWGNAGMIVPSHFIPLAAPGMISRGVRWMFDSASPFYVKPRLSTSLIKWGCNFYKSSTREHVTRSIPVLKEISLLSLSLYKQLAIDLPFEFGFQQRGLLMLYQTAQIEKEETETARLANEHGIEAGVLSGAEVQRLEPDIEVTVRGGVYFPGDGQLIPQELVSQLIPFLKSKGVLFQTGETAVDFDVENNRLTTIRTDKADYSFDELIIASGAWSGALCSKLGLSLPMQAGKGYSFILRDVKKNARIPSIFVESRVAVTPMGDDLRFAGTMEFSGANHRINMSRVNGIVDAIPRYYPGMNVASPKMEKVWSGLRPCSPDGLPYIGRTKKLTNVIIASGHSMMGMSLGPATGKLVAEIIDEEKSSMNLDAFNPERF